MLRSLFGFALCIVIFAAQAVPTNVLNHDVTPNTLNQTICVSGYTKTVRPSTTYTNGIKKRFMRDKGMDFDVEKGSYELDHIIPLALGGHPRNLNNLMLQPWDGHDGAKLKDRLEVKLQCLVCSGDVPLDVAQEAIWSDWHAAYSTYGRMVCHRLRGLRSGNYGDK
jgi:hypothetical protein